MDSPVGVITLVGTPAALTGLYLEQDRRQIDRSDFGDRADERFAPVADQLAEYFAGERSDFDLCLAPVGNDFFQRVWAEVCGIEYGRTATYAEIARRLGGPTLARAVGRANGQNPISIIIPCHRVVGSNGSLTGYAAGLARKRQLLDLEHALPCPEPRTLRAPRPDLAPLSPRTLHARASRP